MRLFALDEKIEQGVSDRSDKKSPGITGA